MSMPTSPAHLFQDYSKCSNSRLPKSQLSMVNELCASSGRLRAVVGMRWGEKPSFLLSLEQSLPLNVLLIVFYPSPSILQFPHISWWSVITIFFILYLFAYILFLLLTYFTWLVKRSHRNYANKLYLYAQEEEWNEELLGSLCIKED